MRKPLLILTPVLFIFMFYACSKSNNNNSSNSQGLVGTWNFLGVTGGTKTVVSEGLGVTMVAYPAFVTTNNTGSITFSKDSMNASGVGYAVDTAFWAYFYYGGVVYDSTRQPLSYTVPPTSTTSKYNLIGTDSLYFPKGGLLTALDSASTGQGCKYVLKGDSLLLTSGGVDTSGGAETSFVTTITLKRSK
jgi:hypothetical protein